MRRGLSATGPQAALAKNRVNIPGTYEAIWQPLYDYQSKTAAATASQLFFQEPIGTNSKTLEDTNMTLNGNIPKGQMFEITGIEVEYYPDLDILQAGVDSEYQNDVMDFYRDGALILTIGSKQYVRQGNLMQFAPQHRLGGIAAIGATSASMYASACGREFSIVPKILESSQNFSVELQSLSATSTTGRLGVRLNGYLWRNAQ